MPFQSANFAPLTPLDFLNRSRVVFRNRPAVVYGETTWTYGEFADRCQALAGALHRAGVEPGDRVAALLPNVPAMLEAHFGVPMTGALLVAINTRLSPGEVSYILDHSGAKVLVVDTELAAGVRTAVESFSGLVVHVSDPAAEDAWVPPGPGYEEFLAGGAGTEAAFRVEDEATPISINYTSGTTGNPKGVVYSHRGAALNALGEIIETGLSTASVYLWTLPMFHCNGWCFPWAVTAVGATHVCLRRFDPAEAYRLIERWGVTHLCGAPTVLRMFLAARPTPEYRFARPVHIVTAAAPPSPTLIAQVEDMGARLTHVYGLTEVYGPHTVCAWHPEWDALPLEERARLKARQGVAYTHAAFLRVVDENMQDVPADGQTLGEVVMRGNNVMLGYYRQPEATAEAFRGGWFHSGDLAVVHPDGYIELKDRKKDIIISGGENISTIEVENTLYKHPAVAECAVVGVPDEKWGEVPKAFVTLKPGATATAEELRAFCRERLAHFKCPKHFEFCELPKTSTGKIRKNVLRQQEWSGAEDRIRG
ncbi:MAG: long-chain-fatty-acid--CoA ligase [Deltaproteobacteria bacterium]|nr:long-chain-fatty-acid--CoA ligase [Deltaproteobacteria bacterium]